MIPVDHPTKEGSKKQEKAIQAYNKIQYLVNTIK